LATGQIPIGGSGTPYAGYITSSNGSIIVTNSIGNIDLKTSSTDTFTTITLTGTSNQLIFEPGGSSNTITLTCTNPATNRTYTLSDVGANSNFVMDQGTQTINGLKTFTTTTKWTSGNYTQIGSASSGSVEWHLQYCPSLGSYTIDFADSNIANAYSIPNTTLGYGTFALQELGNTFSGANIFSALNSFQAETFFRGTPAMSIQASSGANSYSISPVTPSASRTLSINDPGGADSFVFASATQTLLNKTLNSGSASTQFFSCSVTGDSYPRIQAIGEGILMGIGSIAPSVRMFYNTLSGNLQIDNTSSGAATTAIDNITAVQSNGNLNLTGNGTGVVNINSSNGITINNGSPITSYITTTGSTTMTGIWASGQTLTFTLVKLNNMIHMYITNQLLVTSNSSSYMTSGAGAIPSAYRPTSNAQWSPIYIINNGGTTLGTLYIATSGTFNIFNGFVNLGAFTSGTGCGWQSSCANWALF
jgi:hypothetical protein